MYSYAVLKRKYDELREKHKKLQLEHEWLYYDHKRAEEVIKKLTREILENRMLLKAKIESINESEVNKE